MTRETNREAAPPRAGRTSGALLRAGASVGILTLAVVAFGYLVATRPQPPKGAHGESVDRVPVIEVIRAEVPRQWVGFGTVGALVSAEVPSRVGATVAELPAEFQTGAEVAAGDLLVRLDDSDFTAAAEIAGDNLKSIAAELASLEVERGSLAARLLLAEQELELAATDERRAREAAAVGSVTAREVDRVQGARLVTERAVLLLRESLQQCAPRADALAARHAAQTAALSRAADDVERCRILSPISGTLSVCNLEVGESVAPGQWVARVVDASRVEVPVALPASARGVVAVGDSVRFVDGQETLAESTIARISPEDDATDRTMSVWVEVDRRDSQVRGLAPGAFVEAMVTGTAAELRSVLPRRAVRNERVLVLDGERLRPQPVRVAYGFHGRLNESGIDDQEWLVLEDALPEGTLVAIDASRTLRPGRRVVGELPGATAAGHATEPSTQPGPATSAPPIQ